MNKKKNTHSAVHFKTIDENIILNDNNNNNKKDSNYGKINIHRTIDNNKEKRYNTIKVGVKLRDIFENYKNRNESIENDNGYKVKVNRNKSIDY